MKWWHATRVAHSSVQSYDGPQLCGRHYTFYLWKNWFAKSARNRLLLAPLYMWSANAVVKALLLQETALWVVGWLSAVCLTLVPAWLLELR